MYGTLIVIIIIIIIIAFLAYLVYYGTQLTCCVVTGSMLLFYITITI